MFTAGAIWVLTQMWHRAQVSSKQGLTFGGTGGVSYGCDKIAADQPASLSVLHPPHPY